MFWSGVHIGSAPYHGVAYDFIRRQIHSGAMRPGERFPAERNLAKNLGISRATLREALKRLEAEEYLTATRGAAGGNFANDEDQVNQLAHNHMLSHADEVWRSLEYLKAILEQSAILSCQRRTPPDIALMRQASDAAALTTTGGDLRDAQHRFLMTLARSTLNALFARGVDEALAGIFHPIPAEAAVSRRESLARLWLTLTEAISARQKDDATGALSDVFSELSSYVLSAMGEPSRMVAARPPLGSETHHA